MNVIHTPANLLNTLCGTALAQHQVPMLDTRTPQSPSMRLLYISRRPAGASLRHKRTFKRPCHHDTLEHPHIQDRQTIPLAYRLHHNFIGDVRTLSMLHQT